ncbi:hypothetical protein M2132_000883 [Dysgonomonas sp. PH5-45]|uniref:calycin-like domain-containing protein n=1 Tax=unclassified Dysgonomonas TaxID=2630389 RepID=UPI002475D7ED|nr:MULTISPECIES: calycin-like domain-containing protein [unclassified Dysgonomonas]MDH6354555.1 hypothetical protein [Dysgonomonas sp. PH5-45]MDH6387389.1 hypothetical protein [Dysgonomonas sp. PH5-37]
MKKLFTKKLFLSILVCLGFFLPSMAETVDPILGNYSGSLKADLSGMSGGIVESTDTISLESSDLAGAVKFVIRDFKFTMPQEGKEPTEFVLGDIVLDEIPVVLKDGVYSLKETVQTVKLLGMNISITISGEVKGEKADIVFTIKVPFVGNVPVEFSGEIIPDKEGPSLTDVTPILGNYGGDLKVDLAELNGGETLIVEQPDTVSLEASVLGDAIKFAIRDFKFMLPQEGDPVELSLGDIILDEIPVTLQSNGIYVLQATAQKVVLNIMGVDMNIGITIKGFVEGNTADILFTIEIPVLGSIPVFFKGTKIETSGINDEALAEHTPVIWTDKGVVYIQSENNGQAVVYTLSGQVYKQVSTSADVVSVNLPKGVYLVSVNGYTQKVFVK